MFVEIDQAAVGQDLTLVVGQRSHVEVKCLGFITQHIGLDVFQVALERFTHIGDEDVIPQPEGRSPGQLQRLAL